MKALAVSLVAVLSAVLEPASTAIADEVAPPAVYVPPVRAEMLSPDSVFAQQAVMAARGEPQKWAAQLSPFAAQVSQFKARVIESPKWLEVQFAHPGACESPCTEGDHPQCGVVFDVQLDKNTMQALYSYPVRDVRCPTS